MQRRHTDGFLHIFVYMLLMLVAFQVHHDKCSLSRSKYDGLLSWRTLNSSGSRRGRGRATVTPASGPPARARAGLGSDQGRSDSCQNTVMNCLTG